MTCSLPVGKRLNRVARPKSRATCVYLPTTDRGEAQIPSFNSLSLTVAARPLDCRPILEWAAAPFSYRIRAHLRIQAHLDGRTTGMPSRRSRRGQSIYEIKEPMEGRRTVSIRHKVPCRTKSRLSLLSLTGGPSCPNWPATPPF